MKKKNREKTIALVIPSLQAGGMERVMSELASFFAQKNKLNIHLVLYGITRELFYSIPASIILHQPSFTFNNRYRLISSLRTLIFLRRELKNIRPDTILSFGEYWNSFVLISLFATKIPVFVSDRCQPDKKLGTYHDFLRRILYRRAKGIIAQTKKAKDIYFEELKHGNIKVIGNPIRQIDDSGVERENIVLMVGRLIKTKHHDQLIEIFLSIAKKGWKLVIVGYDHLKQNVSDKLLEIIRTNNAQEKVILAGKQSNVDKYYMRSKIFAFTSSSEGFPNVIGEAMSAGLPAIAYDCIAGPSEMIVNGKTGFLVPLFDKEMFRQRLEELMDDENKREMFGSNARSAIKGFSIDVIGKKYLDFILDI